MQITPKPIVEIIKGDNDCFFELEGMCQHIESEFEKCQNVECKLYKVHNPVKKRD